MQQTKSGKDTRNSLTNCSWWPDLLCWWFCCFYILYFGWCWWRERVQWHFCESRLATIGDLLKAPGLREIRVDLENKVTFGAVIHFIRTNCKMQIEEKSGNTSKTRSLNLQPNIIFSLWTMLIANNEYSLSNIVHILYSILNKKNQEQEETMQPLLVWRSWHLSPILPLVSYSR